MRPRIRVVLSVLLAASPSAFAQATAPSGVVPGDVLRVWQTGLEAGTLSRTHGTLVSVRSDSIRIRRDGGGPAHAIERASIVRMEQHMTTTSRRQRILRGMGGGFAAGAIVGALTMALNPPFNGQDGSDDPAWIVFGAAYLGVLGSIPGGVVGAFCCDKWRDVSFATAPTHP